MTGIVVGLLFGVVWGAVGYTAAGFLLAPVLMAIQRRLTGVGLRAQLQVIWPPLHASLWGVGAYLLLRLLDLGPILTLVAGGLAYAVVLVGVLWLVHRRSTTRAVARLRSLLPRRLGGTPAAPAGPDAG